MAKAKRPASLASRGLARVRGFTGSGYREPPRGEPEAGTRAGEGASRDGRAGNAFGAALDLSPRRDGQVGRRPCRQGPSSGFLPPGGRQPLGPLRGQIMGACRKQRNYFKMKKQINKPPPACLSLPLSELWPAPSRGHRPPSPRGAAVQKQPWTPCPGPQLRLLTGCYILDTCRVSLY